MRTAASATAAAIEKFRARLVATKANIVKALIADVQENTPVDTGELRAGWHDDGTAADLNAATRISNEVEYGPYVEFGTSRMEPRGMMQRTIANASSIAADEAAKVAAG